MFGAIISERTYHVFSYSTTICSIIVNLLLMEILLFAQLKHVGAYRWLLFSFATVDILISLNHTFMLPAAHMTEFGYIFFGYRFLHKSTDFGVYASLLWVFLFYQSFVLLAFHYVYRYVIIFNPPWTWWMQRNPWRNWATLAVLVDVLYAGSIVALVAIGWSPNEESRRVFAPKMKKVYDIDLFADNMPGYLALTYWIRHDDGSKEFTPLPVFTMILVLVIIFTAVIIIFLCLIRILREMRRAARDDNLESKTKGLQRTLIRALLWQTIIPTIVSYIPVAFIILFPSIFEISLGGVGTVVFMSLELFPILDPLLIIYFITGFRVTFRKCFERASVVPAAPAADFTSNVLETKGADRSEP